MSVVRAPRGKGGWRGHRGKSTLLHRAAAAAAEMRG